MKLIRRRTFNRIKRRLAKLYGSWRADELADRVYMLIGRYDLALPMYREAVDIIGRKLPDHWMLGGMRARLGRCIVETGGDLEEAESLIRFGIDRLETQWGPDHEATREAYAAAVALYDAWDRPAEADVYRQSP